MSKRAVPMFHVPDVRATVDWYERIGFDVLTTYGNEGDGLSFAVVSFGTSEVMFSQGGEPSTQHRREVDLYVYTDNVDDIYTRLKDSVDVVEGPHDTFYGMREFIFRDFNRFWLTFAQQSVFGKLMRAVQQGDEEVVRNVVTGMEVKPETLNAALAAAVGRPAIEETLKQAGAIPAPEVDPRKLDSYTGKYGQGDFEFNVTFMNGSLFGAPGRQEPLRLMALDDTTFRTIAFDDFGTVTFIVESGETNACTLNHGSHKTRLERAE